MQVPEDQLERLCIAAASSAGPEDFLFDHQLDTAGGAGFGPLEPCDVKNEEILDHYTSRKLTKRIHLLNKRYNLLK